MSLESLNHSAYLALLEAELAGIEAERAAIERKQSLLQDTIGKVKQLAALTSSSIGPNQIEEPTRSTPDIPKDTFKGMTNIVHGAVKLLGIIGEPLKTRALVDTMLAFNFPTKAQDPYITFRSVLMREMKKKGTLTYEDKMWGLPEWEQDQNDSTNNGNSPAYHPETHEQEQGELAI